MTEAPRNVAYNERLLSGRGLRSAYHHARYYWVRRQCAAYVSGTYRVVELGCFDAKTLAFLPKPVELYVGLDAGWDGGLELGRALHAGLPEIALIQSTDADVLRDYADGHFTVAIALETLEHIEDAALERYLGEIARTTGGPFFITVPNELGLPFLFKYLVKRLFLGDSEHYSAREFLAAVMRRSDKISRREHKGFDISRLIRQLSVHFDIRRVEAVSPSSVPARLALTVGIVAYPKARF